MVTFKKDDYVAWKWANGMGHGCIRSVHAERTEIQSKGKSIIRNGMAENPAVAIQDHNGVRLLKRANELQKTD